MQNENYPKKNIARLIQRANDIVVACRNDKDELTEQGLSWNLVQELAELVPQCSDIDVQYRLQKETNELSTSNLKDYLKKSVELRTQLAEDIRMAFEKAEVNVVLSGTWQNRAQSKIVQDLNDFAVLVRVYQKELQSINFNFELVNQAACASKELAMMIAYVELDRETIKTIELPNRYTMLNTMYSKMKEICKYGRRAFNKQPGRRFPYRAIK
jgi:hypothetical protein